MLDSGAEGPGFKSQPRRCRVTVCSPRVARVTAGLAESNGRYRRVYDSRHLRLTAKNRDQLRNHTLDIWACGCSEWRTACRRLDYWSGVGVRAVNLGGQASVERCVKCRLTRHAKTGIYCCKDFAATSLAMATTTSLSLCHAIHEYTHTAAGGGKC